MRCCSAVRALALIGRRDMAAEKKTCPVFFPKGLLSAIDNFWIFYPVLTYRVLSPLDPSTDEGEISALSHHQALLCRRLNYCLSVACSVPSFCFFHWAVAHAPTPSQERPGWLKSALSAASTVIMCSALPSSVCHSV
jgi:hypothetical protein